MRNLWVMLALMLLLAGWGLQLAGEMLEGERGQWEEAKRDVRHFLVHVGWVKYGRR